MALINKHLTCRVNSAHFRTSVLYGATSRWPQVSRFANTQWPDGCESASLYVRTPCGRGFRLYTTCQLGHNEPIAPPDCWQWTRLLPYTNMNRATYFSFSQQDAFRQTHHTFSRQSINCYFGVANSFRHFNTEQRFIIVLFDGECATAREAIWLLCTSKYI